MITYINGICSLSRSETTHKSLALVEIDGNPAYMIGIFADNGSIVPGTGMTLTKREIKELVEAAKKGEIEAVLTEEEKFMKDYVQQSRNGAVFELEKEMRK